MRNNISSLVFYLSHTVSVLRRMTSVSEIKNYKKTHVSFAIELHIGDVNRIKKHCRYSFSQIECVQKVKLKKKQKMIVTKTKANVYI